MRRTRSQAGDRVRAWTRSTCTRCSRRRPSSSTTSAVQDCPSSRPRTSSPAICGWCFRIAGSSSATSVTTGGRRGEPGAVLQRRRGLPGQPSGAGWRRQPDAGHQRAAAARTDAAALLRDGDASCSRSSGCASIRARRRWSRCCATACAQNIAEPLEAESLALTLVQRALGPRTTHVAGADARDGDGWWIASSSCWPAISARRWTLAEIAAEVAARRSISRRSSSKSKACPVSLPASPATGARAGSARRSTTT